MAKENAQLLVVDHSPEGAEEINSLLRNSGIIIRINFAKTIYQAEKSLKSNLHMLLIYNVSAAKSVSLSKLLQLAEKHGVNAAIRFSPEDPAVLVEALNFHSCIAINIEEDGQLIKLVQGLLESGASKQKFDDLKARTDELQARYELLLDSSRESTAYIHEGLHIYANRAYLELLQVENFDDIEAVSLLDLMSSNQIDLKKLLRDMNKGSYPEGSVRVTISNPAGNKFESELIFSPARYDGEDCIQMMVQEIDANATLKSELARLKNTDPVTQFANRKAFVEALSQHIAQEHTGDNSSAVFYLEADGSQELFASLGASAWDIFMIDFAAVIKACINEDECAARFNDHAFALLIHRDSKRSLQAVGKYIVSAFAEHNPESENHSLSVTCSIGITTVGSLSRDADEVIDQARSAFTQASQKGNCTKQYQPQLEPVASDDEDQSWVDRIRYAIDNQDLYSVQQSIVNLEGESEGLFESKTFLCDQDHDLQAEQFMPIAERNDLGTTIDRHVIKGLLAAIAGTGDRHIISLSTNSLMDFSFPSWFIHQLEECGVQGSQVILQLSAIAVEANLKTAKRLIDEIRPSGCEFSLSLFDDQRKICALLDQLDILLIKLKPGLTENLKNNSEHQTIVRNVVKATSGMPVDVFADDIQDAADLAVLWQCGVKLVAGDFLNESPQVVGQ